MTHPQNRAAQNEEVLRRLSLGEHLTPKDALRFGCFRLAARVYELRNAGHHIVTEWEGDGDRRYARYVLLATGRTTQAKDRAA